MNRRFLPLWLEQALRTGTEIGRINSLRRTSANCVLAVLLTTAACSAQIITVDTSGKGPVAATGPVDRQYAQIQPTRVELTKTELDDKTRLLLIRALQSEQGFAMRPLPRGHKGLTLAANGKLDPAGTDYLNMVVSEGLSAKPGSRVVITDIKIDRARIVFDLDGGPDAKHSFLSHVQIGVGPEMGDPNIDPTVAHKADDPLGSRLTLTFADHVPELTPAQVKALLAPLISFDVKSQIQAFTDTLPPALKDAIFSHKVLVGMSTDMVLFAKGQPATKLREIEGQMPFEEWIYGTPPEEVDFVRINGSRVIRVEVAKEGQPLQIFTKDVVSDMLRTDGSPVQTVQANTRTVREGDVQPDTDKQAPAAPPTLRKPGETMPTDNTSTGVMRPVQFPKPHPDDMPGANPDEQSSAPPASSQSAQPQPSQTGNAPSSPANAPPAPANGSQAAPAKTQTPPAPSPSQPAANSSSSQPATQRGASPSN
jgi:hypothetical protein